MSQRPGAGPQGTRPANSGPQAAQSNPAPRRRGPAPPQFVLQMEPDGPSASPKNARDVNPDDPLHEAVTSSIMVALALMRSDKGKYRLPTTGEDVFKYVREPDRLVCTRSSGLQEWADEFIAQMSKNFMRIILTNRTNPRANGSDMWFERSDWKSWTPDSSGTMFLNKFVRCSCRSFPRLSRKACPVVYQLIDFKTRRSNPWPGPSKGLAPTTSRPTTLSRLSTGSKSRAGWYSALLAA